MPAMKTNHLLACAAFLSVMGTGAIAPAVTWNPSAHQGYMFYGASPARRERAYIGGPRHWGFGGFVEQQTRGMDDEDWKMLYLTGFVSYDIFRWLSLYATAGQSDLTRGNTRYDASFAWGGGAYVRFLDYLLLEPLPLADSPLWLSIDGNAEYFQGRAEAEDDDDEDMVWGELHGALTACLNVRPERYTFVDRIGLYGGVACSFIGGGEATWFDEDAVTQDQPFGFVAGLVLNPTDNFMVKAEGRFYDSFGVAASVAFHF
jgi:opacity protein-like surface antigen